MHTAFMKFGRELSDLIKGLDIKGASFHSASKFGGGSSHLGALPQEREPLIQMLNTL